MKLSLRIKNIDEKIIESKKRLEQTTKENIEEGSDLFIELFHHQEFYEKAFEFFYEEITNFEEFTLWLKNLKANQSNYDEAMKKLIFLGANVSGLPSELNYLEGQN